MVFPTFEQHNDPFIQISQASNLIAGVVMPLLQYRGPARPSDPLVRQALFQAYRSEVLLSCAVWAERHGQPHSSAADMSQWLQTQPLHCTELRLWLPHFYFDEDEGLPSAEPDFTDVRGRLEQWRDLLLFGPPGGGKTTVLHRLACELAIDGLAGQSLAPLPILVDLSRGESGRAAAGLPIDTLAAAMIVDLEGRRMPLAAHRLLADLIPELLTGERLAFLWDGLDAVPRRLERETRQAIESLRRATADHAQHVITCRTGRYMPSSIHSRDLHVAVKQAAIQSLDNMTRDAMILVRLGAERGNRFLALLARSEYDVAASMTCNPFMLQVLCDVYERYGEVPSSEAQALTAFLAARFAVIERLTAAPALVLRRALARMAFEVTATFGRGSALAVDVIARLFAAAAPGLDATLMLRSCQQAGILESAGDGMLRFSQSRLQDYFAALALRDHLVGLAPLPAIPADAGCLKHPSQPEWRRDWIDELLFLPALEPAQSPVRQVVQDAVEEYPLEAARRITASGAAYEPGLATLVRNAACKALDFHQARFDLRLSAGRALGLVGDPRNPVSLDEWRIEPARTAGTSGDGGHYWRYVAPGTYQIGGWEAGQPTAELQLAGFWIGRFPVTVAQFVQFVIEGYRETAREFWTSNGWNWRAGRTAPDYWDDPSLNAANQPIVGISWYEAAAYGAWLSARLGDALPPGYCVRLPTEAEWEVAAAFDPAARRRVFPWGDAPPTMHHLIFKDSGVQRPAPVGCCPAGAAACGALDMLGNIEEWCAGWYRAYPVSSQSQAIDPPPAGNIQLGPVSENHLAVRGGWWAQDTARVGCGARFWYYASATNEHTGFRLALAPIILSE